MEDVPEEGRPKDGFWSQRLPPKLGGVREGSIEGRSLRITFSG